MTYTNIHSGTIKTYTGNTNHDYGTIKDNLEIANNYYGIHRGRLWATQGITKEMQRNTKGPMGFTTDVIIKTCHGRHRSVLRNF